MSAGGFARVGFDWLSCNANLMRAHDRMQTGAEP
jgi:hypothetical protein